MEHDDKIKKELKSWLKVFALYLAIALLIVSIIILIKNIDEIQTDPIPYGIEKKGFTICSCYDTRGNSFDYNEDGLIPKKEFGWNVDLPN